MSYKNNKELKEKLVKEFTNKIADKMTDNKNRIVEIEKALQEKFDKKLFIEAFELKGFNDGLEYGIKLLDEFNQKIYVSVLENIVFNGEEQ